MDYIKSLHIEGLKKYRTLNIEFNDHMNIIVGENEAGKSTILEAIKIVLNQQYKNADKAVLKELFNSNCISDFISSPSIKTLPSILIEMELCLNPNSLNSEYFYGEAYGKRITQEEKFGIRFECRFDEELGIGLEETINSGKIPYEYYSLTWTTYGNHPYQMVKRPLNFLFIDTSSNDMSSSYNYYNRTLFNSKYDENTRVKAKNEFRNEIDQAFGNIHLPDIDQNRKFGIDGKKVVLESIISVFENSIALENRGSGMESIIKTQMAIDRKSGLDVIAMEEPENHLCFSNLNRMLSNISKQQNSTQIIVTTHSSLIASRLNLKNVLWITGGKVQSLNNVDDEVADFFVKADNNSFLQLLLSKKAFLVEGATEFLLVPYFYKQVTGRTIEDDGISIIACNGITYERYLRACISSDKKIAVITDNDHKQAKIDSARMFNEKNTFQHLFMGNSVDEWTWEACIYAQNKNLLDKMIPVEAGAEYLFHNENYGQVLGKMLNNKVDIAYQMLMSNEQFTIPQYIKDSITWINE